MGITKREIAAELGVSKRTIANYIGKLGLGNHVSRNGNTDILDDFAAAAIADALKNPGKPSRQPAAAPAPDSLADSLAAQLEIERSRNAELMEALAAERDRAARADAKAKRDAEECERIEGAARAEQHRKDLLDCWGAHIDEETLQEGRRDHTAYQWCDLGFVPIAEARWRLTRYGGNSAWYYCSPWDVRYDPDRAKELLETGPREYDRLPDGRPYDGRPWWQA